MRKFLLIFSVFVFVFVAHRSFAMVSVNVDDPNGGEKYSSGQTVDINWTADPGGDNIVTTDIEFSSNGGGSYTPVTTLNGAVFTYEWTTPDLSSANCLIRVTVNDDNGGSLDDVSDATFTVAQAPVVTVTAPDGGEELDNGVQTTIEWDVTSILDISESVVEFSDDNGNSWSQIGTTGLNDFDLLHTFNGVFSDECLIRVTAEDELSETGEDDSDAIFTVSTDPVVTVTYPNGAEELVEDNVVDIEWDVTINQDVDESVIELSLNNGGSWTQLGTTNGNDFDFEWTIPDEWSETCLIRVTVSGEFGYSGNDVSDAVFTVAPIPDVTVTLPDGGEGYVTDDEVTVTWTVTGGPDLVEHDVYYSIDNGNNWVLIGTTQVNDLDIVWTIPDVYSEICLVRVVTTDEFNTVGSDLSDAVFRISNIPDVEVTYPDGGEELLEDDEITIQWDVNVAGQDIVVNAIELSIDGGNNWAGIGITNGSVFEFDWTVPDGIYSDECLIRVTTTDEFGTATSNISDNEFQISQLVRTTVTAPDGGEVFISGDDEEITWHAWHGGGPEPDFATHVVSYSTDGGNNWTQIGTTNGLDFDLDWEIPNLYSTNCLVRIVSTDEFGTSDTDVSDAVFTISPIPVVELNNPNGGGLYIEGNQLVIEWDVTTGGQDIDGCVVSLSSNNGATYNQIGTTQDDDFTFDWQIPDLYSLQCLIKITATDEYGTESDDVSDAVFTVAPIPDVEVVDPNGGEHFIEDNQFEINWSVTGGPQIDECLIELSTDNGANWDEVTTNGVNDFNYDWTIPDEFSTNCLLKITATDEYGTSDFDVTDAVFTITPIPDVDVTEADGGEHYIEGDNVTFIWELGPGPDIDESVVALSIDGGNNWTDLGTTDDDDYDFAWVAPDMYELDCMIRITSTDIHGTVGVGISNAVFGVSPIPDVEVIYLNGGEHVIEDEEHQITWNVTGGPQIVENILSYSTDNGANWIQIGATEGPPFEFDWTVPDAYSFECLIKVTTTDEYGAVGFDESDAVFTTTPIPDVVVLNPNGGEDFDSYDDTVVDWDVTSQPAIVLSVIEYTTDAGVNWIEIGNTVDDDYDIDWEIPYLFDLYVVVRVTCTDEYGVVGYDVSDNWFTIAFTQAERTLYRGWTILGLPLHPDNGHKQELIGRHMVNFNPWDFFGFSMATSFHRPDTAYCGNGYLLTMFQDSITVDLTGYANRELIEVDLDRGWNLIGNPFPETIPVGDLNVRYDGEEYSVQLASDLDLVVPIFYEYENSQYVLADPLRDWRGYWFVGLAEGAELLILPQPPGPIPTGADEDLGTFEAWELTIQAQKGETFDRFLTIGANENATNRFDARYDYPDPPSNLVDMVVDTYFEYPQWLPSIGSNFNHDIREQLFEESAEWIFEVSTDEPGEVTLSWDDIFETTPPGYEFEIIDGESGQVINPRAQESYSYHNEDIHAFSIRVNASLDADNSESLALPTKFSLSSVYPNPFNNLATIQYALPRAAEVSIQIFDINGNLVDHSVDGAKSAGYHKVVLNGENLAGGIYFIKMISPEYNNVRKAVLLK